MTRCAPDQAGMAATAWGCMCVHKRVSTFQSCNKKGAHASRPACCDKCCTCAPSCGQAGHNPHTCMALWCHACLRKQWHVALYSIFTYMTAWVCSSSGEKPIMAGLVCSGWQSCLAAGTWEDLGLQASRTTQPHTGRSFCNLMIWYVKVRVSVFVLHQCPLQVKTQTTGVWHRLAWSEVQVDHQHLL